jgi:WD40 repeat protein
MRFSYRYIGYLLDVFLLVSCTFSPGRNVISPTPSPMRQATSNIVSNKTNQPSHTLSANTNIPTTSKKTPTPTESQKFIHLSTLPKGQYLIFVESASEKKKRLGVLSFDGKLLGYVMEVTSRNIRLSNNLKYAALDPFSNNDRVLYDLEMEKYISVPSTLDICGDPSWSPNDEKLALDCEAQGNAGQIDIYVLSYLSGVLTRLTDCKEEAFICADPSWSPDGRWLAYIRALGGAGASDKLGLHLIDTTCLSDPTSCLKKSYGPFSIHNSYTWSPDGHFIASVTEGGIRIFEVSQTTLSEKQLITLNDWPRVESLAWSKDGKNLTYNVGNDIFLMSLETHKSRKIYNTRHAQVVGCIEIK